MIVIQIMLQRSYTSIQTEKQMSCWPSLLGSTCILHPCTDFFQLLDTCYHIQNMQEVTIKEAAVSYVLNVHIFIYTQTIVSVNCFIIRNTNVAIRTLHFTKQFQKQAKRTQRFQLLFNKNVLKSCCLLYLLKTCFIFSNM